MHERENWLVISHAFNMDGRAASHTMTDKIPYLLARGINPVVISAMTGEHDRLVEHHRLLPLAPSGLRFDLRHIVRRRIGYGVGYKLLSGIVAVLLAPFYAIERLFVSLEPHWSFFVPAYVAGARLIRKRDCTAIYSSGGASSGHYAGYLLAKKTGLPWIAEVHDPMVVYRTTPRRQRERFAGWLEGKICDHADVAIWFVQTALDRARERHPSLGNRGHVMSPGADAPSFGKIPYVRQAHLVIAHFGSLAPSRNLSVFLAALTCVLKRRPEIADIVRVELYGGEPDKISADAIARLPARGIVRAFGRLEYDAATGDGGRDRVLKRMQTVDALLLLHGEHDNCEEYIPSKLYEYLWTQRPIIGLVRRNPHLSRILADYGHWAVDADDATAVSAVIEELAARWQESKLADNGRPSPFTPGVAVDQIIGWLAETRRQRQKQKTTETIP